MSKSNRSDDENKLVWMQTTLEKIVKYLNNKYPSFHIFSMIEIDYDGESWEGMVHPVCLTDTNMCMADRVMLTRRYRTDTYENLIDQMMETVSSQDTVYENYIQNGGKFIDD